MTKEAEDKGFKVNDRRYFTDEKTEGDEKNNIPKGEHASKTEETKKTQGKETLKDQQFPLPEMNFSTFIFSLNSSALFHLGEIPDPVTNKSDKNLPLVKQTIDIIGILKDKTKGNLTKEEDVLINNILYDLRIRYVEGTKED